MNKKELPIGTVVMLVGGSKKVMITGYRSKNADADRVFDYNGCIFPEGLMENIYCLFDASQIEDVLYLGLENEEQQAHMEKIHNSTGFTTKGISEGSVSESTHVDKPSSRRTPKAPTNPMSKGEMMSKYGVATQSDTSTVH